MQTRPRTAHARHAQGQRARPGLFRQRMALQCACLGRPWQIPAPSGAKPHKCVAAINSVPFGRNFWTARKDRPGN
eukprot:3391476-Alexandrium_andersonii.AAC.1